MNEKKIKATHKTKSTQDASLHRRLKLKKRHELKSRCHQHLQTAFCSPPNRKLSFSLASIGEADVSLSRTDHRD